MSTVWVLQDWPYHESPTLTLVFANKEDAEATAAAFVKAANRGRDSFILLEAAIETEPWSETKAKTVWMSEPRP